MAQRALTCPKCKSKLAPPEGAERFRCPSCKTVLTAPKPQATEPPDAEDPLVGQELGGYSVTRVIGRGGMGTVYEAIQQGLKRRVALKVLPSGAVQDAAFLSSFRREAQAVAKLNHPNILQIFDIVSDQGYHFFSMEYVEGGGLVDRLKGNRHLPLPEALDIVAQVAAALEHAYEHMLIHRDIKPSNILLTERGEVKLADLGLSKCLEETAVGIARGTHGGPVYMAPEFVHNPQLADCRSDTYALGGVLFHMLTGRPPFPGPSIAELIDSTPRGRSPPPERPRPRYPRRSMPCSGRCAPRTLASASRATGSSLSSSGCSSRAPPSACRGSSTPSLSSGRGAARSGCRSPSVLPPWRGSPSL